MTCREIRSAIGAADWAEFVAIAIAGGIAGRLERGKPVKKHRFHRQSSHPASRIPTIIIIIEFGSVKRDPGKIVFPPQSRNAKNK